VKVLWCDTETTGLEPQNAGAFQIAMLFKHGNQKTKVWQRLFFLNPLDERYGIATRPGAHCAPLVHRTYKTEAQGIVRFSFSTFNTTEEIEASIDALGAISESF